MEGSRRSLTSHFEPATGSSSHDNENSRSGEPTPTIPPSFNIIPPQPDSNDHLALSDDDRDQLDENKGADSISGIFKPNGLSSRGRERPKLSLRTSSISDRGSASSSKLTGLSSNDHTTSIRMRRRSNDSRSSRGSSNNLSDHAPRSARVLSYIQADDMDEFQDIQKDFQSAMDEEGRTWLPQIGSVKSNADSTHSGSEQEQSEPEDSLNDLDVSTHLRGNSSTLRESNQLHNSPSKSITKNALNIFQDKQDEDSTLVVELADLDDIPGRKRFQPLKLYGNSLGLISPTNKIRLKLASLQLHPMYKIAYQLLLTLFTALMAFRTYQPTQLDFLYSFSYWVDYTAFFLCILFTLNDTAKVIAFGLWDDSQMFAAYGKQYTTLMETFGLTKFLKFLRNKYGAKIVSFIVPFQILDNEDEPAFQSKEHKGTLTNLSTTAKTKNFEIPRAFLRSSWNRIDFTSTICFWMGLFLAIHEYDIKKGIRIFKTLAFLRILRLVNTDTGLSSILRGVKYAIPQLINIGSMFVYFWLLFGILGVQSFRGSLRRQCVWFDQNDSNDRYQYENQFCGGFLEPITKKVMPYLLNDGTYGPASKGFLCPQYSKCISNANPYNGRVSFDNIVNAMELVFVVMSANTFTDLMYYTMDSDEMAASIFFVVAIFVLNIWLMNLVIAVLVTSFQLANEEFKRKKLEVKTLESWPIRLATGYWRYFQVKAQRTKMPTWAKRGQLLCEKIEPIMVILIVVDLAMRCRLDATVSESYTNKFIDTDTGICTMLLLESIFKLIFHIPNPWKFLIKWSYVYDLVVGIAAFIITLLKKYRILGDTYYWLSIFHISRFYRVVYMFGFTSNLWKRVLGNRLMIWNLSAFYFFFTFLVSIIMSVYFEGILPADEMEDQQFGMFSLPNSFLSLFIIGSTENWTSILYSLQSYATNISSSFFSSVLLIVWFILSNSVILNIFIALISETMEVKEEEKRPLQIKHYLKYIYPQKIKEFTHASFLKRLQKKVFRNGSQEDSRDFKQFLMRGTAIMNIAQSMPGLADELKTDSFSIDVPQNVKARFGKLSQYFSFLHKLKMYAHNPFYKKPEVLFTEGGDESRRTFLLQLNEHEDEKLDYLKRHPSFNNSYFILSPHHAFRKFCQRLVPPSVGRRTDNIRFYDDDTDLYGQKVHFHRIRRDIFVVFMTIVTILLIVFSCFVTPLYRMEHKLKIWSWPTYVDCAFVSIFTIEFIVKTVADGVFYTPNGYLRNPWNFIDSIVLISLWINLIAFLRNDGDLSRIFKGLTALRALRCLTVSNMARNTFSLVVFDGIRKIFEASFVSLTLLFPFTVWGMNLFRGKLGTCNDGSKGMGDCNSEFTNTVFNWDIMMPRVYSQPYLFFDSFGSSFRSLYEIVSLEGWTDLLENLMNSTGVGTPASLFASSGNAIFLVLFNFLSMVFILNLFVSFIINNHAKTTGSAYFTTEEKSWLEAKKLLSQAKPRSIPSLIELSNTRRFFYGLAVEKSNFFYAFLLQVVLYLHIIMLLCRSYRKPNLGIQFEDIFFMVSTTIFFLQEIFHLYGEGLRLYVRSIWNKTRFAIVITSFVLTAVGFKVTNEALLFNNVKELFHLVIFLFVIPQNDMLSELVQTAVASWPPILSLTFTWGILFLVYSIALNQIFGLTKLGPNTSGNINFRTVPKALIVLFRCSFGEGWNYIMADLAVDIPYCYTYSGTGNDCGSELYAYLLLMSWNILSMYIFLNMFISLIIGNFSYVYRRGGSKSPIGRREILKFVEAWTKYDTDGTGELEFSYLPKLMHSFDGPLSFTIWEGSLTIKNLVKNYMEVNPNDPYDVQIDLDGLNRELDSIDKVKVIQRRLHYRRFTQEVFHTNSYRGAIGFSSLLKLIPLYTIYNPRECLGIDEYVRHLYNLGKVDKYLDNEKNFDVLNMVVTAWKYQSRQKSRGTVVSKSSTLFQTYETITNPFNSVSERSSNDFATTPLMDFGVDNFLWSPKLGGRKK